MTYLIKAISLSCQKCDNWQVQLLVDEKPEPFELKTVLHPHAIYMATGVVTDGPEAWIDKILVLERVNISKEKKSIKDWHVGDSLQDAFPQLSEDYTRYI
ncbi:MAG: hypothetical protein IJK32_02780 [Bacteroidales bacterium]|nr:hypothetical protein [Bacteroidales bacterium]